MDQKDCHKCDYKKCGRSQDQFTRKDHYRDHLRDFHKEDLGCAKGGKNMDPAKWEKAQQSWIKERQIDPEWWRCVKCLARVYWREAGWECQTPNCKMPCETERVERRQKLLEPEQSYVSDCSNCAGTGWIENMNRDGYVECYLCRPSAPPAENYYYPDQTVDTSNYTNYQSY
jgi:hypothetical protein